MAPGLASWPAFTSPLLDDINSASLKRRRSPDSEYRPAQEVKRHDRRTTEQSLGHTSIFSHSTIGDIKTTKIRDGVRQFLGIQYATLQNRFAAPEISVYNGSKVIDGTKLGSQVLDIPNGPDMEQKLIQKSLPYDRAALSASDTDGLNMNITVPTDMRGDLVSGCKLPVFVFIHGGGFQSGSAMWPQYNMSDFADLSRTLGKPCIAIAFNYRLGAAGLLTSTELQREGYKANNSILDQRAALLWIQKHVAGFGGDPSNVTIAGPVSVAYHLQSKETLFKRAIILSVTSLQLRPLPAEASEKSYESLLQSLGLKALTNEDTMKQLLAMDAKELRQKLQSIPLGPVVDASIPLEAHTYNDMYDGRVNLGARDWCDSLIIGDCQFDGSIFGLRLGQRKQGIAKAFCYSIRSSFAYSPEVGEKLLDSYDLAPETPDEIAFKKILEFGTDVAFYAPTVAFAEGLHDSIKVFMYRFNEPNPWEGPWKGVATHALDVHFLLQNYRKHLEPKQQKLAEEMADCFFDFMYGIDPWDEWLCNRPTAKVFGPHGMSSLVPDDPCRTGRRDIVWKLAQSSDVDSLFRAFMSFLKNDFKQVPPQPELPSPSSSLVRQEVSVETSSAEPPPPQAKQGSPDQDSYRRITSVEAFLNDLRDHLNDSALHMASGVDAELQKERALHQKTRLELVDSQEKVLAITRKLQRLQNVVAECVSGSVTT